jgi:DNA polymerase-4
MQRTILHSDLNGFYASVECLYHPKVRHLPVAVGGDPEQRHGIILAKNQHAKKYGITTGEAIWQAKQKCPILVLFPPDFAKYLKFGHLVRNIYKEYSDRVEPFGLDEAWIDMTGNRKSGEDTANEIRQRIKYEIGITASVGVSDNKIFAKLGSDMRKPDATTIISQENFKNIVWPLPASDLLYVGRSTANKLSHANIRTIGDIACCDPNVMRILLGKWGKILWLFANGLDSSPVAQVAPQPFRFVPVHI